MDNWTILGITPTDDKEEIRRAYMTMLPKHNPETDAEGFTRLRLAYDQLIKELGSDKNQNSDSPMAQFVRRLDKVYQNFNQRCDINAWKELLKDEACMRLDLEEESSARVLTFLMGHYYIPQQVWILLNDHFDWASRRESLKHDFPLNFVDFAISSAEIESLDYNLFSTDTDYAKIDRFIWLYYEMESLIHLPDITKDPSFIEMKQELESLPIKHVYYDMQIARLFIFNGDTHAAYQITEPIYRQMPNDNRVSYTHALSLLALGQPSQSLEIFREISETSPQDFSAKKGVIESMIELGEYEPARTMLLEILDEYPYNPFALHSFRLVTERLTKIYEKMHETDPNDMDTILTLAKHYLNGYKYDQCRDLLSKKEYEHPKYYEYLADCYSSYGDNVTAIELYEKNIALEKRYRSYVKYITALIDMNRFAQALLRVEEALQINDPDELSLAYLYDSKGLALHKLQRYNDAILCFNAGLKINDHAAHIHIHKARSYQRIRRYAEAIECCQKAIDIFPYTTESYTIQMEIFYDANLFGQMLDLCEQAYKLGFDSPRVKYHKARALRRLNRFGEAMEILTELLNAEFDEGYSDYFHAEIELLETGD